MNNYMITFSDESEAIEVVVVKVPEKYTNRYIYGDTAPDVELVTFPNIYINRLPDNITSTEELAKYTASIIYDEYGDMTLNEMAATLTSNTPDDFLEKIKGLSAKYDMYITNINNGDEDMYEKLDKMIQDFYSEVNLVKDED